MISMFKLPGIYSQEIFGTRALNCTDIPLWHWIVKFPRFEVAVNVNRGDIEPRVLIKNDRVFLGAEQGIFVLDMITGEVIGDVYGVPQVQWIDDSSPDIVVFSAEDELVIFDISGHLLWRKNLPDIIETTTIENNYLDITVMSGNSYRLKLIDGSLV